MLKPSRGAADSGNVPFGLTPSLLTVLLAGAAGVFAVLYTLAANIRNQTHVHDLKLNVLRLRTEYQERLRRIQELEDINQTSSDVVVLPDPQRRAA